MLAKQIPRTIPPKWCPITWRILSNDLRILFSDAATILQKVLDSESDGQLTSSMKLYERNGYTFSPYFVPRRKLPRLVNWDENYLLPFSRDLISIWLGDEILRKNFHHTLERNPEKMLLKHHRVCADVAFFSLYWIQWINRSWRIHLLDQNLHGYLSEIHLLQILQPKFT